jgi:DNA-binding SARP family transcriptional activator/predicted ATPase
MWHIELMGTFRVTYNDREFPMHTSKRASSLLAYLAFRLGNAINRDELTEAIWPDDDPEAARARLRTTLTLLRKLIDTGSEAQRDIIQADRQAVTLDAEQCTTDIGNYYALLRRCGRAAHADEAEALFRNALAIYGGDLLPQFEDAWIAVERQTLLEKHINTLRSLARLCVARSAYEDAIEFTRQEVACDPLNEDTHVLLMEMYVSQGKPASAIKQYQQLERMLEQSLQTTPSPKAVALYDRIRNDHSAQPKTPRSDLNRWQMGNLKPLFGRQNELLRLAELVAPFGENRCQSRLVTVFGPGGVGKTHISQVIARNLTYDFGDRVWFVPLADLMRPHQIEAAIADAMCIDRAVQIPLQTQILDKLAEGGGLLILDNFEHLTEGGDAIVEQLLKTSPDVRILITSRRHLNIAGEHLFELLPFHQPDLSGVEGMDARVEAAAELPGVSIFLSRAQAVRPGLSLTEDNVQAILDICCRLEGLPLSLEIAASRASVLSVQSLRSHLDDQLDLLVEHRSQSPLRHKSVRNTIHWSYSLLTPELKSFLLNLSVFRGGWLADAAYTICVLPPSSILHCLDLLDELRTCSLITTTEVRGQIRFTMLFSITAFAGELLAKSGEVETVCDRHQHWFTEYVEQKSPESRADIDAVMDEYQNIVTAIEHGLRDHAASYQSLLSLRICTAMKDFWMARGLAHEASLLVIRLASRDLPEAARAAAQTLAAQLLLPRGEYAAADELAAEALSAANSTAVIKTAASAQIVLARSACLRSDYTTAFSHAERACRDAEEGNFPVLQAEAHILMGMTNWYTADFQTGLRHFEQALALYQVAGSRRGQALSRFRISTILRELGDLEGARRIILDALPVYRELGDIGGIAMCVHDLGLIALFTGDKETALEQMQEAMQLFKQVGNRGSTASCLANIAEILRETGRSAEGIPILSEAHEIYKTLRDRRGEAGVMHNIAQLYLEDGNPAAAKTTMYTALELETAIGSPLGIANANWEIANICTTMGELDLARVHFQHAAEMLFTVESTHLHAEILISYSELLVRTGELDEAILPHALGTLILQKLTRGLNREFDQSLLQEVRAQLINQLGADRFEAQWSDAASLGESALFQRLTDTLQ